MTDQTCTGSPAAGWQPIETAPKDGTRVLLRWESGNHIRVACGDFDMDRYNRKPRPYWSHDLERAFGKIDARINPPKYWMPIPGSISAKGET